MNVPYERDSAGHGQVVHVGAAKQNLSSVQGLEQDLVRRKDCLETIEVDVSLRQQTSQNEGKEGQQVVWTHPFASGACSRPDCHPRTVQWMIPWSYGGLNSEAMQPVKWVKFALSQGDQYYSRTWD